MTSSGASSPRTAGLLTAAMVVACGTGDVSRADGGPYEDLKATEVLRIGSVDGEGPEIFGRIIALAFGPEGSVLVADAQASEIRMFDRLGGHLRSLGGRGQGPGEFTRISWVASRGDRILVWDDGLQRITQFDPDGSVAATTTRPSPWVRPAAALSHPATGVWGTHVGAEGFERGERGLQEIRMRYSLVFLNDDFVAVDSLPSFRSTLLGVGDGLNHFNIPFRGRPSYVVDSEEPAVWFSRGQRYEVVRVNQAGDTVARAILPDALVAVTSEELDAELERARERDREIDAALIPAHRPAVLQMVPLPRGGVGVFAETTESPPSRTLDLFNAKGEFEGRVNLGQEIELAPRPIYDGERLYAVATDSMGVEYVVAITWQQ